MHAKFEGENLKIERAVSILVKWVSIMWSNLKKVLTICFMTFICLNIELRTQPLIILVVIAGTDKERPGCS
jgi:hypothetical protein